MDDLNTSEVYPSGESSWTKNDYPSADLSTSISRCATSSEHRPGHEQGHKPDESQERSENHISQLPQEAYQTDCQHKTAHQTNTNSTTNSTHNDSMPNHLSDHTHDKTSSSLSEQIQECSPRPDWHSNKRVKNNSRCFPIDRQSIIGSAQCYGRPASGGSTDKVAFSGFGRQDIAQIESKLARGISSADGLLSDSLIASVVIPSIASVMIASSYLILRAKALLAETGNNVLKENLLDVFDEASPTDEKEGGGLESKNTHYIRSGCPKIPLNSGDMQELHKLKEVTLHIMMMNKDRLDFANDIGNPNLKVDGISIGKTFGYEAVRDLLESVSTAQKVDIILAAIAQEKFADSYPDQRTLNLLQYALAQTKASMKSTKKTTKKVVSQNHETRSRGKLSQQEQLQQLMSRIRNLIQFNNADQKGSHTFNTRSISNNNGLAEGEREPTVSAREHGSSELPSRVVNRTDSHPSPGGPVVSEDRQISGAPLEHADRIGTNSSEQAAHLLEEISLPTGTCDSYLGPEVLYSLSDSGSGLISLYSLQSLVEESRDGSDQSSLQTSSSYSLQLYCQEDSDSLGLVPVQPSSIQEWLKRIRLASADHDSDSEDSNPHVAGEDDAKDLTKSILRNREGISTGFNSALPPIIVNIISTRLYPINTLLDLTTWEGRLESFLKADVPLLATDLAMAGFSSSSILDRPGSAVFCFRCRIELDRLNDKLNVMALHKTFGEDCPFMLEVSVPEIHLEMDTDIGVNHEIVVNPLVVQTSGASATPTPSEIYKHHNTLQLALAKSNDADGESNEDLVKLAARITRPLENPNNDFREFGVMSDSPKHPNMALESNRKESMKTYHNTHLVDPKAAVTAGFFWSGQGDLMICFSCGIEHSDWTADIAPLKRHMVISPKCIFLLSMYNQEYIDQTIANEPSYTPPPRQVKIESVPVRAVKPRNEVPLAANIRENFSLFFDDDPPPKRVVEKTWEVIEERIRYGEPDYTRECDLVKDLLEKERAMNESATIPPEDPLQSVNRSTIEESDVIRIQPKYRAQTTDGGHKLRLSGQASRTSRHKEREPLDLDPAEMVSIARCLICLDEPKEIMFVPCTHLATCTKCGLTQPQCPVCRRDVKGTVRVSI